MTVTEYKDTMEGNLAYKLHHNEEQPQNPLDPTPLKYTSVMLTEVQANNLRLEASAFNLDAKAAKYKVEHCPYGYVHLWGENGLVKAAYHAGRFKRNYVEKNTIDSIGFLGSSEMLNIKPQPLKYIKKQLAIEKHLLVKKGTVLLSCSGTIGNTTYVNHTLEQYAFSQHIIRLECEAFSGYIYACLNLPEVKNQILSMMYGAVIQEIEPEHLKNIIIPNAPEGIKQKIHEAVIASYDLRDQSNELIDSAEALLYQELQLPPIEQLKPKYFDKTVDLRNYTTRLNDLDLRLDCSYHAPIVHSVEKEITKYSKGIITIGDISKKIILAGVFKRVYVDKDNGVPFLGGRDITQLTPQVEKYLSITEHANRIKRELEVFENYILISDRGTIGKIQIVPKHWEGWAVSQNIIKVVPINNDIAGYLFCFLNSDYGQVLIKRETYGSVVDMIDDKNVSKIKIPLLKNETKQREINDMVLQANALRYQAHLKEQEAIEMMEGVIEGRMFNL